MTLELEWSGQDAYRGAELREWTVEGKPAGKTRSGGGLTFATIYDAGHMVRFRAFVLALGDRRHSSRCCTYRPRSTSRFGLWSSPIGGLRGSRFDAGVAAALLLWWS